jgi:hypothetical protein
LTGKRQPQDDGTTPSPEAAAARRNDCIQAASRILGFPGAMLARSKTGFREQYPDDVVVFNANVVVASVGKVVWQGDLSLTRDHQRLSELATVVGATVYLLFERDGRFENAEHPLVGNAVAMFEPDGQILLDPKVATWLDGEIVWTHPGRRSKRWRKP